ncbi:MAG: protein of unknown function with transrane region [Candidatus Parcubacteria bacterium]|nr:protein of unknown function with transrane region [Candidatus Parcubacteria bacterium]
MKKNRMAGNRGFIKTIIIIVIALLAISYYGLNLRSLADSPTTKDNFSYVASTTVNVWNKYLSKPATYVWNQIFLHLIWEPAMGKLRNMDHVDLQSTSSPGSY